MPKTRHKKTVVKKKLIGFTQEMLDEMEQQKKALGTDEQTEVIRQLLAGLLTGEQPFMPSIEEYLRREQRARGLERGEMIEMLLLEALKRRDSKFQVP